MLSVARSLLKSQCVCVCVCASASPAAKPNVNLARAQEKSDARPRQQTCRTRECQLELILYRKTLDTLLAASNCVPPPQPPVPFKWSLVSRKLVAQWPVLVVDDSVLVANGLCPRSILEKAPPWFAFHSPDIHKHTRERGRASSQSASTTSAQHSR